MPVRQLPEQIVNRIAAGEVVERPASVVKELVENAIDAGASRIDVFTDGGGRRKIAITDDGSGMTANDLALAVERHATSKLDDEDLLQIKTLGFRGEALPSIGAVAKLAITTRHASEPHAWAIAVTAGVKSEVKPAALGQGTVVEVRDLFFATPARLKFLKTDRTEAEAIRDVVRRLAMSRPDVAFTLAGEERSPITWGAALPGAVRGAYADYLPRDRHPVVALFIAVEPREVDVNVHPAKTEVRFRDGALVRGLIVRSLKDALLREGQRAATTGGSATIATFRPAAAARRGSYDWRRSPARPSGFAPMRGAAAG